MNITAVLPFKANFSPIKNKECANKAHINPSNNYSLSSYNIAFKAMIKNFDRNPGVTLDKDIKDEIAENVRHILEFGTAENDFETPLKGLFEKYGKNQNAMKYIISQALSNKDDVLCGEFIKAYFNLVNSFWPDDKKRRKINFEIALNYKDDNENTIVHRFLNNKKIVGRGVIPTILEATKDFPSLQVQELSEKNERGFTIGQRIRFEYKRNDDAEAINKALYNLCGRTKSVNRNLCINLLETNANILDKDNQQVLVALKSEDCLCYGELSKEEKRTSFQALDTQDHKRLDSDRRQITLFGARPDGNSFVYYTPVEMAYMCLSGNELYDNADSKNTAVLCDFYNKYCEIDDLIDFYTIPDVKGRYVVSGLVKSIQGIQGMNNALKDNHGDVLYKIYSHKDSDGKTLANYLEENGSEDAIKAANEGLVEICSVKNSISMRRLKSLLDKYSNILDANTKAIQKSVERQLKKADCERKKAA